MNRALEFLPSDDELAERRKGGAGLTRPELAILLAYSKIWLNNHLLASNVPEDPYLSSELERYFPAPVRQRFPRAIAQHRLRREIIATATTNSLVNRMGPTFVPRAQEDTGAEPAQIARAYTAAREIFEMRDLWTQIEALDTRVPAKLQYGIAFETSRLLRHVTYWLLASRRRELQVDAAVAEFRSGVRQLEAEIGQVLTGSQRERYEKTRKQQTEAGLPTELAASTDAGHFAVQPHRVAGKVRRTQPQVDVLDRSPAGQPCGDETVDITVAGQDIHEDIGRAQLAGADRIVMHVLIVACRERGGDNRSRRDRYVHRRDRGADGDFVGAAAGFPFAGTCAR